jgi:hypothetical protein
LVSYTPCIRSVVAMFSYRILVPASTLITLNVCLLFRTVADFFTPSDKCDLWHTSYTNVTYGTSHIHITSATLPTVLGSIYYRYV